MREIAANKESISQGQRKSSSSSTKQTKKTTLVIKNIPVRINKVIFTFCWKVSFDFKTFILSITLGTFVFSNIIVVSAIVCSISTLVFSLMISLWGKIIFSLLRLKRISKIEINNKIRDTTTKKPIGSESLTKEGIKHNIYNAMQRNR